MPPDQTNKFVNAQVQRNSGKEERAGRIQHAYSAYPLSGVYAEPVDPPRCRFHIPPLCRLTRLA